MHLIAYIQRAIMSRQKQIDKNNSKCWKWILLLLISHTLSAYPQVEKQSMIVNGDFQNWLFHTENALILRVLTIVNDINSFCKHLFIIFKTVV